MINKFKPLLSLLIITASLAMIFVGVSMSTDQEITCDNNGCSGLIGALFEENNLAPSGTVTRKVKAVNNYSEARNFAVEIVGTSFTEGAPSLADVLQAEVKEVESGNVAYGPKTITEWKDDGLVTLTSVPSGGERNYEFKISFDNVGNEYQGQSINFDMRMGFEGGQTQGSSTDDGGEILGVSTEGESGIIGSVLGLSTTTGAGFNLRLYAGAILILLGLVTSLKTLKKD